MRAIIGAATAVFAVASGAAFAADQDFTLVNSTGYQIDRVFVSQINQRSWGSDVMGRNSLADGQNVRITFRNGTTACRFDMKVVYDDGDEASWSGINLCNVTKVTLFWDSKTQTSRATAE